MSDHGSGRCVADRARAATAPLLVSRDLQFEPLKHDVRSGSLPESGFDEHFGRTDLLGGTGNGGGSIVIVGERELPSERPGLGDLRRRSPGGRDRERERLARRGGGLIGAGDVLRSGRQLHGADIAFAPLGTCDSPLIRAGTQCDSVGGGRHRNVIEQRAAERGFIGLVGATVVLERSEIRQHV